MATRSIVKALDVGKDITSGFLTCCIMLVMDEFGFERVEEALHRSVVIAIGSAAHRGPEAGGLHHLAILRRGVLNATILTCLYGRPRILCGMEKQESAQCS